MTPKVITETRRFTASALLTFHCVATRPRTYRPTAITQPIFLGLSSPSSPGAVARKSYRLHLPDSAVRLCCLQRITISGDSLSFLSSLLASRLAALLKLRARYSAENTHLAPEGEPVIACRPIKSHRCPLTLAYGNSRNRLSSIGVHPRFVPAGLAYP
jgi:hypothetical protein